MNSSPRMPTGCWVARSIATYRRSSLEVILTRTARDRELVSFPTEQAQRDEELDDAVKRVSG